MTVLNRLIDYFHDRVFDKDPHGVLAMRVQHTDGCAWTVADGVLTVMAAGVRHVYALQTLTLGQLAARLRADGFTVVNANRDIEHLTAFTLIEGSGIQGQTNGDHLTAYTSLLWVLQNAYAPELRHAKYQIGEALRQMVLPQSEQEWLDLWGTLYGVSRPQAGETGIPTGSNPRPDGSASDDEYSQYIPEEIFRLRVNPLAIESTIKRKTGHDVHIYEPWKDLFHLSESKLDHHRMYDGDYWSPWIIQPVIQSYDNINWDKVREIIERDRPAGVIPWWPEWVPDPRLLSLNVATQQSMFGILPVHFLHARYEDRALLDFYRLDDEVVNNYRIVVYGLWSGINVNGGMRDPEALRYRREFVRAQVVLSDMDEKFGHERVILPRWTRIATNRPVLDGTLALSDFDPLWVVTATEDVQVIPHALPHTEAGVEVLSAAGLFPLETRTVQAESTGFFNLSTGLDLSGSAPLLNYGIVRPEERAYGAETDSVLTWGKRRLVRAQVVLSDMDEPLGHERVRLPRWSVSYFRRLVLGDEIPLSDYDNEEVQFAAEDVTVKPVPLSHVTATDESRTSVTAASISGIRVTHTLVEDENLLSYGLLLSVSQPKLTHQMTGEVVTVLSKRVYSETQIGSRYRWTGGWDSRVWNGNVFFNVITEQI